MTPALTPEIAALLAEAAAHRAAGRLAAAAAAYGRALTLRPDLAEAQVELGNLLYAGGRPSAALAHYRQAVVLGPDQPGHHSNLANVLRELGWVAEALDGYARALVLDPAAAAIQSNLLFCALEHAGWPAARVAAEHRRFGRRYGRAQPRPFPNPPDPERRLRIGYVSSDFRDTVVRFFLEPVLEAHDRAQVEVHAYANLRRPPDAATQRFRAQADGWRDIAGLPDDAAADLVRRDGIDILVDLGGHTWGNRLGVFARRAAPVQVTWLGYPATTGLDAMDYLIADAHAAPPEHAALYTETVLRLPVHACYRRDEVPAGPPPFQRNGFVTFGSANRLSKLNPAVIAAWAALVRAVPGARLFLNAARLDDPGACAAVARAFAAAGLPPDRLLLGGAARVPEGYLASYNRVDIALDPWPHNGGTTTCDALWMGVPVVSMVGDRLAGRLGLSLLSTVGLADLVAGDPAAYIARAAALAGEPARLAALRRDLRDRVRASLLGDAPAFTRHLEAGYREIWQHWCRSGAVGAG